VHTASPIAWEHHYGVLLPIFALLWRRGASSTRACWSSSSAREQSFRDHEPARRTHWNVLQSLLFFSAAALFVLLARARGAAPR